MRLHIFVTWLKVIFCPIEITISDGEAPQRYLGVLALTGNSANAEVAPKEQVNMVCHLSR